MDMAKYEAMISKAFKYGVDYAGYINAPADSKWLRFKNMNDHFLHIVSAYGAKAIRKNDNVVEVLV